jgi:hypothetical protein
MAKLSNEVIAGGLRAMIKLKNGEMPAEDELETAPFLDLWLFEEVEGGYRRLGGFVTGHPTIGPGWCWTSVVLFVSPDARWARTISRYYRLGKPLTFGRD